MKLNERAKIVGVGLYKLYRIPKIVLSVQVDNSGVTVHEILKDKKGSYIKIKDYYVAGPEGTGKVKKYYIKDELWWAVYRFEKYLEKENGCAATQPK